MSRHVFSSAVLLLFVVCMCGSICEAAPAEGGNALNVSWLQRVDLFVPGSSFKYIKEGHVLKEKDSFVSPSLVSAGGVMAAFAEGRLAYTGSRERTPRRELWYSDIVVRHINPAGDWSSLVAEVNTNRENAYFVFSGESKVDNVGVAFRPTAVGKDNKVFLLVGSYDVTFETEYRSWTSGTADIQLVVGEVTQSKDGIQKKLISWGEPKSLLSQLTTHTQNELKYLLGGGGSGIVMENGTLVFPVTGIKGGSNSFSMIMYSTDGGENWVLSGGIDSGMCRDPCITEWGRGQLLMVSSCMDGQKVYESRDMGKTWTEAVGTLSGVWVKPESGVASDKGLDVEALITATIEGRRVMLYSQRRYSSWNPEASEPFLWVTDNNRTFHVGRMFVDGPGDKTFAHTLLYSDGELHLLQERGNITNKTISLSRLTEQLETIKYILIGWTRLDAYFSRSSIPTAGLVGFLADGASGVGWFDEYCKYVAKVTNATKVKDGFQFTGPGSKAIWLVNGRNDNGQYSFVKYNFTLVATVIIHQVPKGSAPLLGAGTGDGEGTKMIGLSYSAENKWETVFNGKATTQSSTWELKKEYQVALMLQDSSKGSVYIDGELVGSSAISGDSQAGGIEISDFYFGGDADDSASGGIVTVKYVFLYNRLLDVEELKASTKDAANRLEEQNKKRDGSTSESTFPEKSKRDGSVRVGASLVLLLLLGLCGLAFFC